MARVLAWTLRFATLAAIAGVGIFVLSNLFAYQISWWKYSQADPRRLPSIPSDASVVIVAPHPDDEALPVGGWLSDAAGRGAKVYAILMTNGDAFTLEAKQLLKEFKLTAKDYIRNGVVRQGETLKATKLLGYEKDVFFLGFPDQGTRKIWESFWYRPYTSPTTEVNKVPYARSFARGSPYEGRVIRDQLADLFSRLQPDFVVMPSRFETHPDHYASSLFSTMALLDPKVKTKPQIIEYIVHRGGYPYPYGLHPYAFLSPPEGLLNVGMDWRSYNLDAEAKANKARALIQYRSQFFFAGYDIAGFYRRNEVASKGGNIYTVLQYSSAEVFENELADNALPISSRDPIGDTAERMLEPAGDVTMIRVVKAGRPVVVVTVNAKVTDLIEYQVNVRDIKDGKLIKSVTLAYPNGSDDVRPKGKNIVVSLPKGFVGKKSTTFVEATTRSAVGEIDMAASFFEERR